MTAIVGIVVINVSAAVRSGRLTEPNLAISGSRPMDGKREFVLLGS